MPKFKLMKVWVVDAADEEAAIQVFKTAPNQNKYLEWAGIKPLSKEKTAKWQVLFRKVKQNGWVKTAIQQVTGSSKL